MKLPRLTNLSLRDGQQSTLDSKDWVIQGVEERRELLRWATRYLNRELEEWGLKNEGELDRIDRVAILMAKRRVDVHEVVRKKVNKEKLCAAIDESVVVKEYKRRRSEEKTTKEDTRSRRRKKTREEDKRRIPEKKT